MSFMVVGFFIVMIISAFIWFWLYWSSRQSDDEFRHMSNGFECGMDEDESPRMPFSLRFFFLVILFMMFDMEMALLLQLPYIVHGPGFTKGFSVAGFLWLLTMGTMEELRRGVLNWDM